MVYIRTTRPATPLLYPAGRGVPHRRLQGPEEERERRRDRHRRRHHRVRGAQGLRRARRSWGSPVRVIDAYSVKPLDEDGIRQRGRRDRAAGRWSSRTTYEAGGLGRGRGLGPGREGPAPASLRPRTAPLRPARGAPRQVRHQRRAHRRGRQGAMRLGLGPRLGRLRGGALGAFSRWPSLLLRRGVRAFRREARKAPLPARMRPTVVVVYDGDTVKVRFGDGGERKVRLIGIDSPELADEREDVRFMAYVGQEVRFPEALSAARSGCPTTGSSRTSTDASWPS